MGKILEFRPPPPKQITISTPPGATPEERKRAIFDALYALGVEEEEELRHGKPPAPSITRREKR